MTPSDDVLKGIENARLVIAFLATRNLEFPKEDVKIILQVQKKIEEDRYDSDCEFDFWVSYNDLLGSIYPSTIDSIAFSDSSEPKTKYLRGLIIACLFLLLATQIYWGLGVNTLQAFNSANANSIQIFARIETLESIRKSNTSSIESHSSISEEQRKLEKELTRVINSTRAAENFINSMMPWRDSHNENNTDKSIEVSMTIYLAKNIFQAISNYFLPILYATLGSLIYAIRQIHQRLEAATLTAPVLSRLRYRTLLGLVTGSTVGLLLTPEQSSTLFGSISPFAVAFIAGYSVEVFFALLDRIIKQARDTIDGAKSTSAAQPPFAPPPKIPPTPTGPAAAPSQTVASQPSMPFVQSSPTA